MKQTDGTLSIVVGFDFSEPAFLALERALDESVWRRPAVIHVLGALDRAKTDASYEDADRYRGQIRDAVEARLDERRIAGTDIFVHARIGDPAEEIVALAGEVEANLICVGTNGLSGLPRLVLGSVSEKVLRTAPCPVFAARPESYEPSDSDDAPAPEPACRACVQVRRASGGERWWCDECSSRQVEPARLRYNEVPRQAPIRHAEGRKEAPLGPRPAADDGLWISQS